MPIDNLAQLRQWQPPYRPDTIIEDSLLLPETSMFLFGSAKSWKTIHSTHLAFCIAAGLPWFGYETRRATVFKVQVELPKFQDKERIMKYARNVNGHLPNIFFQTPEEDMLLDTTYGKQVFIKYIEEVKRRTPNPEDPLVVVIDPVYLLMKGSVSAEEDVKKLQLNLMDVRRKLHVTFVIVHHARLNKTDSSGNIVNLGAEEVMGSSLWNNWCDTMVRFELLNPHQGANTTRVTFVHHRNAQQFHPAFIVKWRRSDLTAEVIQRDIVDEDDPSIRDFVGDD